MNYPRLLLGLTGHQYAVRCLSAAGGGRVSLRLSAAGVNVLILDYGYK